MTLKAEGGRQKEEDLRLRTKSFALRILRLFAALPKETSAQILGKQLLRSGTSIGANYREAYRARSKAEFIAKAGICLGEAEETAYWLDLLVDGEIVERRLLADLIDECDQLIAIFVTILNKAKQKVER
jgi:four helix bundle protein